MQCDIIIIFCFGLKKKKRAIDTLWHLLLRINCNCNWELRQKTTVLVPIRYNTRLPTRIIIYAGKVEKWGMLYFQGKAVQYIHWYMTIRPSLTEIYNDFSLVTFSLTKPSRTLEVKKGQIRWRRPWGLLVFSTSLPDYLVHFCQIMLAGLFIIHFRNIILLCIIKNHM